MDKFRYYRFICLLLLGGVLFFGYEGMAEKYKTEMQEAWEETVDNAETSLSGNGLWAGKMTDRSDGEKADGKDDGKKGGGVSSNNPEEEVFGEAENTVSENDGENETPVWTYVNVDEGYFDDAVFIGDSRTVGLYDYAGLDNAAFYASSGLTIYKLFEDPDGKYKDGNWKENIGTALSQRQFSKVYLMIGINEMGTGDVDYFIEHYEEAVAKIKELQPGAIIYLQSILRVTTERSAKGDYINNEGIDARNERIAGLADNERIFYLDINSVVCDESGGLNPEYTFDGVHLKAKYIEIWKDYLKSHAISS